MGSKSSHRRRTMAVALAVAAILGVLVAPPTAGAATPAVLRVDRPGVQVMGQLNLGVSTVVTVTNEGPGTATGLVVGGVTNSPGTGSAWSKTATTCGASLAAGGTCTVTYKYFPTRLMDSFARTFVTSAGGGSASITLQGQPSGASMGLRVTPTAFDFGSVAVGAQSAVQGVVITNTTGANVTFSHTAAAPSAPFTIASSTCPSPHTLGTGASCTINYRFDPTSTGDFSASSLLTLTETGIPTRRFDVGLVGHGGTSGGYPLQITPRALGWGDVAIGATGTTQRIYVKNTTGSSVSFEMAGGGAGIFGGVGSCGGNPKVLAVGADCYVEYAAHPPTKGLLTGGTGFQITMAGRPRLDIHVPMWVDGSGTGPRPRMTGSAFDLGSVPVGSTTATKSVFLVNDGNAPITGVTVQKYSSALSEFTVTNNCGGGSIAAGGSCRVDVKHTPTGTQPRFLSIVYQTDFGNFYASFRAGPYPVNEGFLRAATAVFLHRAPTSGELGLIIPALDAGTRSRRSVVSDMAMSEEWIQGIVQQLYYDTLGRAGDSGGVSYWTHQIQSGRRTVAQVAAEFYASHEYYVGIGGGTDSSWVTDLYVKLLGRTPDSGGLSYWVGQTASKGRVNVAGRMYQSAESRRSRVTKLYRQLLQRDPDPGGRDYWAGRILDEGDIALAIELTSSTEFLRIAQDPTAFT